MIEVACLISIKRNGDQFLDALKVSLLYEIEQTGSLSSAAKKMKISYQHAWKLVEEMNSNAPFPLVSMKRGGVNGGGAEISVYGEKIFKEFKVIEAQIKKVVDQINVEINL